MGDTKGEGIHSGVRLKHGLGQHILVSRTALERILGAAQLSVSDLVLEIGAGTGVLTRALAERAGHVVGVEIDVGLKSALERALSGLSNVQIVFGDALDMDFSELIRPFGSAWKCVSNLPYYVTSPLLFKLLDTRPIFRRAVLLVQKEVAHRAVAEPGSKRYGLLSVSVQLRSKAHIAGVVPAGAFRPVPEVDSAILVLEPRELTPEEELLTKKVTRLARVLFNQRRKTLINALAPALSETADGKKLAHELLRYCHIDPMRRPETLSLEELSLLSGRLEHFSS
ncbi:MAG TPA: ribosomal RNA small subunit methyltransferase A [Firmicutes bacterium]|nr:ribosomal RNA small subunit methyltransferase A [Bacillota bacterium]